MKDECRSRGGSLRVHGIVPNGSGRDAEHGRSGRYIPHDDGSGPDDCFTADVDVLNHSCPGSDVHGVVDVDPAAESHAGCHMDVRLYYAIVVHTGPRIDEDVGSDDCGRLYEGTRHHLDALAQLDG